MLLKHCNRDKSPTRLKITRMKLYCPLSAYSYCLKLEKKGLELIDILKQRQREEKEQAQTLLILKSLPVFLHAEGWEIYGGRKRRTCSILAIAALPVLGWSCDLQSIFTSLGSLSNPGHSLLTATFFFSLPLLVYNCAFVVVNYTVTSPLLLPKGFLCGT